YSLQVMQMLTGACDPSQPEAVENRRRICINNQVLTMNVEDNPNHPHKMGRPRNDAHKPPKA
ncbi:MAG: hypothetical protein AAFQ29_12320, partial [Pseudomonadota bacterium]